MIVCKQCGTELPDHARFCLQCGNPIPPPEEQQPSPVPAGPQPELDFVQPALAGGMFLGFLSSIPFIAAGNCLCCMWVLLGGGISLLINLAVPSLPSSIPLWAVLLAVGVSMSVGLFFGMSPAIKAARLDPVEALRYE